MKILKINSSSNTYNSVTRKYVDQVIERLSKNNKVEVVDRDVTVKTPSFIDSSWIGASFSKESTPENEEILKESNMLIDEILDSDVLVIGAPMYNFSIPASLKAYFDQIARAHKTFKYTENGPVGLINGKKAYVVIASGGVPIGSSFDYVKGYLDLFLGFIGIKDVEYLVLDEMMSKSEEKTKEVEAEINTI